MHFIHSNLLYISLMVLMLTVLLVVGIVATVELFFTIFPVCVISARDLFLEAFYRFVLLATLVFSMIVILLQVIGGDINAH